MKFNKYIVSLSVLAIVGAVFAFSAHKAEAACLPTDAPSITLTAPNGGQVYSAGGWVDVKWTSCNVAASSYIAIRLDYAGPWNNNLMIASPMVPNTGGFRFYLPPNSQFFPGAYQYGKFYKINLTGFNGVSFSDSSDDTFSIYATPIKLTSPNSGQFSPGQTVNLTWTGGDSTGPVRISLIKVSPFQTYSVITDTAPNTGSYAWTIPNNVPDNTYQFYVQSNRGKPGSTWSYGGNVIISHCDINSPYATTVFSPNGGEIMTAGTNATIKWDSCGFPSNGVTIQLWPDVGSIITLTNTAPNTGSYTNTIPSDITSGLYKVYVFISGGGSYTSYSWKDISDKSFTIESSSSLPICNSLDPYLNIMYPNTSYTFTPGQQINIQWMSCNIPSTANITIHLAKSDGNGGYTNTFYIPNISYGDNDGNEIVTLDQAAQAGSNYYFRIGAYDSNWQVYKVVYSVPFAIK